MAGSHVKVHPQQCTLVDGATIRFASKFSVQRVWPPDLTNPADHSMTWYNETNPQHATERGYQIYGTFLYIYLSEYHWVDSTHQIDIFPIEKSELCIQRPIVCANSTNNKHLGSIWLPCLWFLFVCKFESRLHSTLHLHFLSFLGAGHLFLLPHPVLSHSAFFKAPTPSVSDVRSSMWLPAIALSLKLGARPRLNSFTGTSMVGRLVGS